MRADRPRQGRACPSVPDPAQARCATGRDRPRARTGGRPVQPVATLRPPVRACGRPATTPGRPRSPHRMRAAAAGPHGRPHPQGQARDLTRPARGPIRADAGPAGTAGGWAPGSVWVMGTGSRSTQPLRLGSPPLAALPAPCQGMGKGSRSLTATGTGAHGGPVGVGRSRRPCGVHGPRSALPAAAFRPDPGPCPGSGSGLRVRDRDGATRSGAQVLTLAEDRHAGPGPPARFSWNQVGPVPRNRAATAAAGSPACWAASTT